MFKKVCLVLAMCLSLGLFAACGGPSDPGDDNPTFDLNITSDYVGEIKFAYQNDPSETRAAESLVQGFNALYPHITVELIPISSYETQILGDFGAGEIYDVFWVADNSASMFYDEGMILPLDEYVAGSGLDLSQYYESMINLGRYNHSADEPLLMFPRSNDTVVTFLNVDRFKDAEVAVPTDMDWTWEDMVNICEQLKSGFEKAGKNYYALDASFEWTIMSYALLKSWGGDDAKIINAEGYSDWGTPENKGPSYDAAEKMLTECQKMFKNGYVSDPSLLYNNSLFRRGQAAMWFTSQPSMYSLTAVDMELKVLPFPAVGDNPQIPSGTTGYAMARGSQDKPAAWAFLKYLLSENGQKAISENGLGVPVLRTLAEDENAAWRQIKDYRGNVIPSEAFVYNTGRVCTNDYYDSVPAYEHFAYNGLFVESVNSVFKSNTYATPADAIRSFTNSIEKEVANWK